MKPLARSNFAQILTDLAAKQPAPGGGASAAATGALAAATGSMVVAYSLGKKSLAEHQPLLEDAAARLERARGLFLELADEDAAAYEQLNALMKLPADDARRVAEYPGAVAAAIAAPRGVLGGAIEVLRVCDALVGRSNKHLGSDLAIAAVLGEAAAASAAWNIRINLPLVHGKQDRQQLEAESQSLILQSGQLRRSIEQSCAH